MRRFGGTIAYCVLFGLIIWSAVAVLVQQEWVPVIRLLILTGVGAWGVSRGIARRTDAINESIRFREAK